MMLLLFKLYRILWTNKLATYFYVEFDVVGSQGNPFSGYYVNGTLQSNPHYIATIESQVLMDILLQMPITVVVIL